MGAYKWYLTWAISDMNILFTVLASWDPELPWPHYEMIAHGIPEYFNIPWLAPLLRIIPYTLYEMHVYITICRFVYRYAQTTGKQKLMNIMSHGYFFTFLFVLMIALFVKGLYFNRFAWSDWVQYKLQFPNNDTKLKEHIMNNIDIPARPNKFENFFQYAIFPSSLIIYFFCTVQCYRYKTRAKNTLSKRTLELYQVLIHGLVVEQLAEFLWFFAPLIYIVSYDEKYWPIGFHIMYRFMYTYPTFLMIFTLGFFKPYRASVKRLVRILFYGEVEKVLVVSSSYTIKNSNVATK
ncbi:unnamed protein product [Bursaphelenchus okinawaensis]|uniref:Serpentine receptor class gamma n=1 Tax=Bursaphelenchus okinawaensis TaxID=465554 RepID=A0A811KB76_9BILA|nr:unnamed protein product [Bursaphelenchus okinawaensis]CAG9096733.1 unnamed protein product [Bursaphelenchus okinawaensis]